MRTRPTNRFLFSAMAALSLHHSTVEDPAGAAAAAVTDAAAKAAADKATADKVAADKVAADKVAADKAAAAAAEKSKADQLAALKGVLTLPQGSTIDPAISERTAVTLHELGLTPDQAPKVFGLLTSELASHAKKSVDAHVAAFAPGGAEWQRQQDGFKVAALADAELGAGKPEQLEANMLLAKRVLATVLKDTPDKVAAIEQSLLLNSPDALRIMVRVGKGMKEDQFVPPPSRNGGAPSDQQKLDRIFPTMAKKD